MKPAQSLICAVASLLLTSASAWAACPPPAPVGGAVFPRCVMLLPGLSDSYANVITTNYHPFTLRLLSAAGAPLPFTDVTLDFSGIPDLTIAAVQPAGTVVVCVFGITTVTRATDAAGMVTFLVRGAGRNSLAFGGIGPGGFNMVKVSACAVALGTVTAVTPDENGAGLAGVVANGIEAGDGAFFRYDLFNFPLKAGRSDFNCNGMVDPADGSLLRDYILNDAASGPGSGGVYCP